MATISIGDNDARIQHTIGSGGNTANVTQFPIDFPFFSLDDINVIITDSSGTDTTITRGTGSNTFAVTGTAVEDGFSGGNITLGSVYTSVTVTIFRDIDVERTSDFATSGPFNISSLNTDLDKIYAIMQEIENKNSRSLTMAESDDASEISLPNKAARKGNVLAFNATTGAAEAGPSIGSITTVSAQSANINTVAGISANVTTVAGIASNVGTVAGIASNVSTVAGVASNVTTVAGIQANVTTVAGIASDVTAVAGISSDIAAVETINANVTTVAGISSNVTTVAGISANVTTVAGISSNVTTVAGINQTHLSNVSGVASNVAILGTSDAVSDLNTLAAISSDITSLANSLEKTYTVTVANPGSGNVFVLDSANAPSIEMFRGNTYIFNQNDATNDGHPLVFKNGSSAYEVGVTYFLNGSATTQSNYVNTTTFNAGRSSGDRKIQIEVATTAPSSGLRYYCYVHGNGMGNTITVKDSNISLVAGSIANVNSVGGALTNVNTVAGSISNVNTVASANSNITTVAGANTNITTVAGSITNVNNVGGSISNVNTVASNISGVNSFADRYRVASSAPTSSLDIGDLYFDTTANELKVYKSSGWAAAGSTVNGTSARFTYNITGTPTTLTGASGTGFAEANGETLAYDAGFIDVYLNGVKQVNGTDVTVTSGTSVVFANALSNGDTVDIVAFGTFNVAAINANNINAGTIPNARFPATLPAISGANLTNLDASDLASGTVPIARIGTGTKNNTTFLRGDNTFTTIDLSTLSPLAGSSSLVTTGALDSGSITSGFGNIDVGSSTITTTGAISGGSATLTGALNAKGGAVFNEDAADVDFRVESSNDPNLLVVDGGSDFVSIGESSQVNGGKLSIATSAGSSILSLLTRSTTDSDEPFIVLQKSSTDSGNFAATVDGEALGSVKFRGVNTSNVSDIGAEINVVQNGTSSTSVPTDIKIRTNEAERMVIKSTTGLIKYNGAFVYYFRGSVNNNASVSIDVPDITSAGATMVTAFYTHHAIQNYGASRISVLGMYIGGVVSTHDVQNITSSGGGSWSYSSPGNNVLRITKNAGTYIGGGHYVVKVETFNGPS